MVNILYSVEHCVVKFHILCTTPSTYTTHNTANNVSLQLGHVNKIVRILLSKLSQY